MKRTVDLTFDLLWIEMLNVAIQDFINDNHREPCLIMNKLTAKNLSKPVYELKDFNFDESLVGITGIVGIYEGIPVKIDADLKYGIVELE